MKKNLPEFEKPPITEVALSLQFEPIQSLTAAHVGLFWSTFRDRFPRSEQQAPIEHVLETFNLSPSPIDFKMEIANTFPVPRILLLNMEGSELIQIQQDRFLHNWRKTGDGDKYPRFEPIKKTFLEDLRNFTNFLKEQSLESLKPDQVEITYVNHILAGEGWNSFGELHKVLTVCSGEYSSDFLSVPEQGRWVEQHIIVDTKGNSIGRLHISALPAYRRLDNAPLIILTMVSRLNLSLLDFEQLSNYLDIGREWIVRGFDAVTTSSMHAVWRKK